MAVKRCGAAFVVLLFALMGDGNKCALGDQPSPDVPYGIAKSRWAESLGNHRARIEVALAADAVAVRVPWRRRDPGPEKKNVVVTTAAGKEVKNRLVVAIGREQGDLVFQPEAGPGEYFIYYLPFAENKVSWQYATQYAAPKATAEPGWIERNGLRSEPLREQWAKLPQAKVVEFQTWHPFHRFDPMEVIATAEETTGLIARHPDRPYLVFPEDRTRPIRMADDLPLCWVRRGPGLEYRGEACRGEFYAFQIGLFAARRPVEELSIELSDLRAEGKTVPASQFHAFNFAGTDWLGRPIRKSVSVAQGKVAPLWFGVQIPPEASPGRYEGTLTLRAKNAEPSTVRLAITVTPQTLPDGGTGELWRMARLKWLDSTIGLDDEVVAPYTPLAVEGRTVRCLGRSVTFGTTGLPEQIESNSRKILARPIAMIIECRQGPNPKSAAAPLTSAGPKLTQTAPGAVACEATTSGGPLRMSTSAKMEADGYLAFRVTLRAEQAVEVQDIRLEVPLRADVARYMMGLERKGGYRPKEWKWTWDVRRATNTAWLGDVDAGLYLKLKGPQDTWDIADLGAGGVPKSWGNEGRGGCTVSEESPPSPSAPLPQAGEGSGVVLLRAYSGPRSMKQGEEIEFRFALLVTPVKPLDPEHFRQRYYHFYAPVTPVEKIAETGANVINCHQGNELNPYINYPFLTVDAFSKYVKAAHARGMKVKTYYTVRELSNYVAEMWPLRSLGREVFADGGGGGHSWLHEHLVSHYASAWHQPYPNGEVDAAIVTTGLSRWHNYYLEGLGWLVKNVGIDGLYLDGIGYDREIMKRVRKVMDRARPGCLIDFHSGNEFPYNGLRISPACKYMEHFSYIDSLWFGEGYDYNETPDYWLVEISGIPFGLYGEMLEGGGNPWRGMVYGMTNRLGWGGDPRPVWKVWDQFGIRDSRVFGYWNEACPVRTGRTDVLATAFVKPGRTLVAVASWAKEPAECRLEIDWKSLGLDPKKAGLFAPAVDQFQPAARFRPDEAIPIYPGRGWLLLVDEEKHEVPAGTTLDVYKDRTVLLEDRFDRGQIGRPWKTGLSRQPSTSLKLSGKEILFEAAANCCAMAERPLPGGVSLVECSVFSGSDKGASWGPGLAVVWPKRILRINLRAEGRYGVDDGAGQWFGGFVAPRAWHHLRIRVEPKEVLAEASGDGNLWFPIHALPRSHFEGDPTAVRIGKMSPGAKNEDYEILGPAGSCSIKDLRAYGSKR